MRDSRNIPLHLTEKEYTFILNMAEQSESSDSSGISKGAILRAMIRLLQQLEVDVSGVKTEDQLLKRLQNALQIN